MKKRIIVLFCSIFIVTITTIMIGIFWRPAVGRLENDILADDFLSTLAVMQQLPGTDIIDQLSIVGLLVGNGNHCDFFSAVLYESELPRIEIEEKSKLFSKYFDVVFLSDKDKINELLEEYGAIPGLKEMLHKVAIKNSRIYFVLYSFKGLPYNGDWRCI